MSFWQKLSKPFFVLAPMHDVTDVAFRTVVAECGKPEVMFTEFLAIDGLLHEAAQERIIRRYLQKTALS